MLRSRVLGNSQARFWSRAENGDILSLGSEMRVSHSIHTEVQKESFVRKNKGGYTKSVIPKAACNIIRRYGTDI